MAIVVATSALAGVLTWSPRPVLEAFSVTVSDKPAVNSVIEAAIDPAPEENIASGMVNCAECGIVVSKREIIPVLGNNDSGAGGGVKRARLKETALKSIGNYEVTVRTKDGVNHQFIVANTANWRPGERIIFIEGRNPLD